MGETKVRLSRELVEIEALLDQSAQRVGRAVRNMKELAVSGLPTSTPGNGSPGGGKGGGRSLTIDTERVPVSSVEASALAGEPDEASKRLVELGERAHLAAWSGSVIVENFTFERPVFPSLNSSALHFVVYSFRCARLLVQLDVPERWRPPRGWSSWKKPVERVWQLTQSWGWVPAEPTASAQRELLATDLTGQWCRSCLRVGAREPRHRNNERCSWCQNFFAVEGFDPPLELAQAHTDSERITEAMVIPYRKAHRERMKRLERGRR